MSQHSSSKVFFGGQSQTIYFSPSNNLFCQFLVTTDLSHNAWSQSSFLSYSCYITADILEYLDLLTTRLVIYGIKWKQITFPLFIQKFCVADEIFLLLWDCNALHSSHSQAEIPKLFCNMKPLKQITLLIHYGIYMRLLQGPLIFGI